MLSVSAASTTVGLLENHFKQIITDYYTRMKEQRGFRGHFARKLRISFSFIT